MVGNADRRGCRQRRSVVAFHQRVLRGCCELIDLPLVLGARSGFATRHRQERSLRAVDRVDDVREILPQTLRVEGLKRISRLGH